MDDPLMNMIGERETSRYYLGQYNAPWEVAQEKCEAIGGHLATIEDAQENIYLRDKLQEKLVSTAFIGCSDRDTDGTYRWINGEPSGFSNWGETAPGLNGRTDYAYIGTWTDGPWHPANEFVYKQFVCELPCAASDEEIPEEVSIARTDSGFDNNAAWPVGEYIVTYEATDGCGNIASCSFKVKVNPNSDDNCTDLANEHIGFIYMGDYVGNKYYVSNHSSNWENATNTCENIGGHLAVINSSGENEFLRSSISEQRVISAFIGLNDKEQDNVFKWYTGDPLEFTNWSTTPQPNGTEEYVYMGSWTTGKWYLANELVYKKYVCEFECGEDTGELQAPDEEEEEEFNFEIDPRLSPNPATENLLVQLPGDLIARIIITDSQGTVVFDKNFRSGSTEENIDISSFNRGMYMVKILGDATGGYVKMLIKM